MIFEFTDQINEIDFNSINIFQPTVAYISTTEFEKYYRNFGLNDKAFSVFAYDDSYFRSKIEVHKNYSFGTLKIIQPDIFNNAENRIAFYITEKIILIICIVDPGQSVRKSFLDSVNRLTSGDFTPERFIFVFIDNLINQDNKVMEGLEFQINNMEDKIIKEHEYKNFNEELLVYKRKLLSLRNYYEQLIDIGEAFIENENDLFDENNLSYFSTLVRKAERLETNVNLLRDNITQLRETYQSSLDMKLNSTMKLFTVITAFFSPLTLIAGWYGMNFRYMPELNWKYGYLYVIILSVCVLVACIIIFKKKKLI